MNEFKPEGSIIGTAANRAAISSPSSLKDAYARAAVLEATAVLCDREHNLHVDLGCMKGIIPRVEGASGIEDGRVRDIALISRVGKPVCFTVSDIRKNTSGRLYAVLSRRRAQDMCKEEYINKLMPGDVIEARVTRLESFGVFCDIGFGISALLPVDAVSVSRIPHPSARFFVGQTIKAIVKERDCEGRISLTHKELLGTWEENIKDLSIGDTVPGIIRSVESYGVFVELKPNLAGLAEYNPLVIEGQHAAVFIKNIIPDRMKIKLVIVDYYDRETTIPTEKYYFEGSHMSRFRFSPENSLRVIETVFDQ